MTDKPDFISIVADNEDAVRNAIDAENFIQAFLLVHSLIESLLRSLLHETDPNDKRGFAQLIEGYENYLNERDYPIPTFVSQLIQFNRRRNRMLHRLWRTGFTRTNSNAKEAASAAVHLYGLFIEWLQTFDEDLHGRGFNISDSEIEG